MLIASGLDRPRLVAVLLREHRRSLAFAGIEPGAEEQVEATERDGRLPLGTSAKVAIKRAMIVSRISRRRRIRMQDTDLLVGILQAELGTVPRALAIAGIDRAALISLTRESE